MSPSDQRSRAWAPIAAAPLVGLLLADSIVGALLVLVAALVWPHVVSDTEDHGARVLAFVLAAYAGPLLRARDLETAAVFCAATLVAAVLRRAPQSARIGMALSAAALALVVVGGWPRGADFVLARGFAPVDGLFYWSPVIWLGVAGAVRRLDAAWGAAALAIAGHLTSEDGRAYEAAVLPLLGASLARVMDALRRTAAAHPMYALAAVGAALTSWNFLFMEQYRRFWIPRDETISFVDVARHNAVLVSDAAGAPLAWPASWIAAARYDVPPGRYEALAASALAPARGEQVVEVASPAAEPLLLEGWSSPRPCGAQTCRELAGPARLVVAMREVAPVDLALRSAGTGAVDVQVNGVAAASVPLVPELAEVRVRLAPQLWRRGFNELRLVPREGAPVAIERVVLRRMGGGS